MKPIRILTYNIHKGFSMTNRRFVLQKIKESIHAAHADIVFLQEVMGEAPSHAIRFTLPTTAQFEFLADQTWPHFAYGKNAVYTEGHHGNAILSKFPISYWYNHDVSSSKMEQRGLLHASLDIPGEHLPLHVFCVHLSLLEGDRRAQIRILRKEIEKSVPKEAPLIIAGDFNDWRENVTDHLLEKLQMKEAFSEVHGTHATTFPARFPFLKLDRIYYRNLKCRGAQIMQGISWDTLSDHLPLYAEFTR